MRKYLGIECSLWAEKGLTEGTRAMQLGKTALKTFPEVSIESYDSPEYSTLIISDQNPPSDCRRGSIRPRLRSRHRSLGVWSRMAILRHRLNKSFKIPIQYGMVGVHVPYRGVCYVYGHSW
jgi:hypothetical protein